MVGVSVFHPLRLKWLILMKYIENSLCALDYLIVMEPRGCIFISDKRAEMPLTTDPPSSQQKYDKYSLDKIIHRSVQRVCV